MSVWLVLLLVVLAALVALPAIVLYRSGEGPLGPARRRRLRPNAPRWMRVRPRRAVGVLHGALALVGLAGVLISTRGGSSKSIGEALVGATALIGIPISFWLKHLKNAEKGGDEPLPPLLPTPRDETISRIFR